MLKFLTLDHQDSIAIPQDKEKKNDLIWDNKILPKVDESC